MSQKWAVLIGIDNYHESLGALKFCTNDVRLIQETLVSECCGFAPDNIVILTDDQPRDRTPTFGNIHSWLGPWLGRPEKDDLVLVYFAGHGREVNDKSLLVPLDATLDTLSHTGIPIREVQDQLKSCKARQKVLILDACHSGGGRDVVTMSTGFRNHLDSGQGIFTIASCDIDQRSYPWKEKRHGIFTYFLAEAIREQAPVDKDGMLSLDSVYEWTRKSVVDWTSARRSIQEPVRECQVKGDIHIAKRKTCISRKPAEVSPRVVRKLPEEDGNSTATEHGEQRSKNKIVRNISVGEKDPRSSVVRRHEYKCKWRNPSFLSGLLRLIVGLLVGYVIWENQTSLNQIAGWVVVAGGLLVWVLVAMVLSIILNTWFERQRNKYNLNGAEECLEIRDLFNGKKYAMEMRFPGVSKAVGGAIVTGMADLAVAEGENELARQLHDIGWREWESSYSRNALNKMTNRGLPAPSHDHRNGWSVKSDYPAATFMIFVISGSVSGYALWKSIANSTDGIEWIPLVIGVLVGITTGFYLGRTYNRWKKQEQSREGLWTAEKCVRKGDWSNGRFAISRIKPNGVDRSRVANVINDLGDLARMAKELEVARRLYVVGWEEWGSSYAKESLNKLPSDDD